MNRFRKRLALAFACLAGLPAAAAALLLAADLYLGFSRDIRKLAYLGGSAGP